MDIQRDPMQNEPARSRWGQPLPPRPAVAAQMCLFAFLGARPSVEGRVRN